MSPLEINILLWHYCRPIPFNEPSDAYDSAVEMFLREGMMENDFGTFRLTEGGEKLVEMICLTPFPIKEWVDPRS